MNISPSRAKRLARTLLRENRKFKRSWRRIAREDYSSRINHATLNRIALNRGAWLPKDQSILLTLGLIKPRAPRKPQKTIQQMTNHEMLEVFQKRINVMNDHIQRRGLKVALGWIKEK